MKRLFIISENTDGKTACDVCGKLVHERSAMMRELEGKDLWLCHSCDATYDDNELKDIMVEKGKINEFKTNPERLHRLINSQVAVEAKRVNSKAFDDYIATVEGNWSNPAYDPEDLEKHFYQAMGEIKRGERKEREDKVYLPPKHESVDAPVSEAVDAESAKKGKLKDDLIRMGALKKDDPIYKGDLKKIIRYAKINHTNEQKVFLARTFHHLRTTTKSPEEVKFWKEFDAMWEEMKEKENK